MERRGREQFVRENFHTELTRQTNTVWRVCSLFRDFNFLAATGTHNKLGFCAIVSPLTWLHCLADCITFILMISRSSGRSWQLKAEGWPQKGRHF